jgi:hypothetical protein
LQVEPDADHQFGIAAKRDFIHLLSARRTPRVVREPVMWGRASALQVRALSQA